MIYNLLENYRHGPSTEIQRTAVEAKRNQERMEIFTERRRRLVEGFQRIASAVIRDRLCGYSAEEVEAAINRSRLVLQGGGKISTAIYHAIGEEI